MHLQVPLRCSAHGAREGGYRPVQLLLSVPLSAVSTPDHPPHFVGRWADEIVPLLCARCYRKGKRIVLGRGVTWDGQVHFQRRVKVRRERAIFGSPEFHVTADGRVAAPHLFYEWMSVTGSGLKFVCPECDAQPKANAFEVARVAGEAIARSTEPDWGLPVLIDPFGGATVGG